jgi:hypothetical protein
VIAAYTIGVYWVFRGKIGKVTGNPLTSLRTQHPKGDIGDQRWRAARKARGRRLWCASPDRLYVLAQACATPDRVARRQGDAVNCQRGALAAELSAKWEPWQIRSLNSAPCVGIHAASFPPTCGQKMSRHLLCFAARLASLETLGASRA